MKNANSIIIEPYYKKLIQLALQAIKSGEPISFVGMYDSGESFLFTVIQPEAEKILKKDHLIFYIDFAGVHKEEEITSLLSLSFSQKINLTSKLSTYDEVFKFVQKNVKDKNVTFLINIGLEVDLDKKFYRLISRLRNIFGWKFNYILFANTRLLTNAIVDEPILEKLVKRNICPVKLLSLTESRLDLSIYEKRYEKKLDEKTAKKIISFSGGNPGLIKAMYLQARDDTKWESPDLSDDRIIFRLKRIVEDLNDEYRIELSEYSKTGKTTTLKHLSFFRMFDFINAKNVIFSPLFSEYLKSQKLISSKPQLQNDNKEEFNAFLTFSERKVFEHLWSQQGKIVSRDEVAKILWGDTWEDKYSDWSIDQLMHTLREKLLHKKSDIKIKTKKGEGYILSSP